MTSRRLLRVWLPVLAWAAIIFAFSSIPSLNSGLGTWDHILRKCAHMTEYAILGFLLLRAVGHEVWALLIGIGYAATDELHQRFVAGRHGSPVDVAIDAVGLMIGIVILPLVVRAVLESRRARAEGILGSATRGDPRTARPARRRGAHPEPAPRRK